MVEDAVNEIAEKIDEIEGSSELDDLDRDMDQIFSDEDDNWEETFGKFEKRQQLRSKALKDQKDILKEVVQKVTAQIEDKHERLENSIQKTEQQLQSQLDDQGNRLKDVKKSINKVQDRSQQNTDQIKQIKEDRKDAMEDVHDRISSTRQQFNNSKDSIEEDLKRVNNRVDDVEDTLEAKIENLSDEVNDIQVNTPDNRLDEVETRLSKFKQKFEDREEKLDKIESRLENEEIISAETDVTEMEDTIKQNKRKLGELSDKLDELSEIEVDTNLKKEIIKEVEDDIGTSGSKTPARSDVLTPSDINAADQGTEVKVKGRLKFRKEVNDRNFYKMSGSSGSLIVCSKKKLPEGRKTLEGTVEEVKENTCLVVN